MTSFLMTDPGLPALGRQRVVVRIDGTYDLNQCEELQSVFEGLLAETKLESVLIDLRMTTSIRSAGLGQLIKFRQGAGAAGKHVTLRGATGVVAETLRCFNMDSLFGSL